MPKDPSSHSLLSPKAQGVVYKPYSRPSRGVASSSKFVDDGEQKKEWEEAACPICLEHPHNAVLLICASHDKGCRPYICDTSYRHSNCLDQYRKAHDSSDKADGTLGGVSSIVAQGADADSGHLLCPLCRGKVEGWKVVDAARQHLNRKIRNCAQEACGFSGPYEELRKHARGIHPSARPSDVDPARQRDWRRLERQRDIGDVLSTIQSAMPGATVLGDYVIDGDDEDPDEEEDGSDFPGDEGNWWTVFLLCQVFGPASIVGGRGLPSRVRGRYRQSGSTHTRGGPLWGENLQGSNGSGGPSNRLGTSANMDGGTPSTSRRRRSRQRGRGDVL
ncbi:unnamed protein product [Sphagnum jensenii]|uniref:Uncharacterized protein n=1 Tax=Sphagnum jensenii TaxID=128206 RepID=A0ABP1BWW2_9BRYO